MCVCATSIVNVHFSFAVRVHIIPSDDILAMHFIKNEIGAAAATAVMTVTVPYH